MRLKEEQVFRYGTYLYTFTNLSNIQESLFSPIKLPVDIKLLSWQVVLMKVKIMIVRLSVIIFLSFIFAEQVEPIEGAILRGLVPGRTTFQRFINNRNDVSNNLVTLSNGM